MKGTYVRRDGDRPHADAGSTTRKDDGAEVEVRWRGACRGERLLDDLVSDKVPSSELDTRSIRS